MEKFLVLDLGKKMIDKLFRIIYRLSPFSDISDHGEPSITGYYTKNMSVKPGICTGLIINFNAIIEECKKEYKLDLPMEIRLKAGILGP